VLLQLFLSLPGERGSCEVLGVSSSLSNQDINLSPLLSSFGTFEVLEAATSARGHQTNWHSQLNCGSLLNLFPEVDVKAV